MPDLITQLQHSTDGLLFSSETDAPVQVFVWRDKAPFSSQALLARRRYGPKTQMSETDLDSFFRPVTTPRSWHGPEEQQMVQRFTALRDLLKAELSDIHVYKIGDAAMDVYVVGRAKDGTYLGVTTKVVET